MRISDWSSDVCSSDLLKRDLLIDIAARVRRQLCRNGVPETIIARATRYVDDCNSKALVLGFARRFATYKRATLILRDEARLARLLKDRKSTRLNSSHSCASRMPSSA